MMMMSDGALSQAEIDALLAGVDSGGGGCTATAVASSSFSDVGGKALEEFYNSTVDTQTSIIATMTGTAASLSNPQITINGRDAFLEQLPETVTIIKIDYNSCFPGEHLFIVSEEGAKAIASLLNKEENIQLDDMAMSVIGEVISQMVGHQITSLATKTGNKSLSSIPPEASNIPKAVMALPTGDCAGITYQLDLGVGKKYQLWEVLGPSVAASVAKALSKGPEQPKKAAAGGNAMLGNSGGNMGGMQMGMGGMGGGMAFGGANVQSVQFPNLMPHGNSQEAGNISLIMDVFMEMTVELGRTRKLIKEILAMGEGTIIELDKLAGEPVDILVNHKLIAKGEVVVIDENFGVRVTEIVSPAERMSSMD
jgi:flagellar motor switch protein FliN/FliY